MTQRVERRRITKERGDPNQEVLVQRGELARIAIERFAYSSRFEPPQHHASFEAALDRRSLVMGEIHAVRRVKPMEDAGQDGILVGRARTSRRAPRRGCRVRIRRAEPPTETCEFPADLLRAQHDIHTASLYGMPRHHREAGRFRLLREGEPTRVLDLAEPTGSRRHRHLKARRQLPRHHTPPRVTRGDPQRMVVRERSIESWTSMRPSCTVRSASGGMTYTWSGCTACPARGQRNGHTGFLRKDLVEQALVLRVQVLDHDEGHAGVRNGAEKLPQRFETSCGGPNSHDEGGRVGMVLRHGPV